jgi:hypothetical protein
VSANVVSPVFIGRQDEMRALDRLLDRAQARDAAFALIGGEAGVGKTRLLKAGGGLYWMIPAVLAGLVGGVINAWLFLLKIPDD